MFLRPLPHHSAGTHRVHDVMVGVQSVLRRQPGHGPPYEPRAEVSVVSFEESGRIAMLHVDIFMIRFLAI